MLKQSVEVDKDDSGEKIHNMLFGPASICIIFHHGRQAHARFVFPSDTEVAPLGDSNFLIIGWRWLLALPARAVATPRSSVGIAATTPAALLSETIN